MTNFNRILPHLISLVVMVVVSVLYFLPQFEGKEVQQGDIIQVRGMLEEMRQYKESTGEPILWTNSMFGGMPTYQISAPSHDNGLGFLEKVIQIGFERPAGYFIGGMLSFYLLMLLLGVNPWLALAGSLLFGLSTNNVILYEAGHTSKVRAIMISPLIIAGMLLVFRQRYLIGTAVFTLGLGINVYANHLQMSYYLAIVLGIMVLLFFVSAIQKKQLADFGKAMGCFVIGAILSLGASAQTIFTTYEFAKDTMRGKPILTKEAAEQGSSSTTDGLDWTYAMQWSNGTADLLSSFIPGAVGGGSGELMSADTDIVKKLGQRKETVLPMYWGNLPFTSGPIYFGVVAFFLFLFGAFAYKGPIKQWIVASVLITFAFSLGNNLEWLNRAFFDYFPLFNKFRTPNSVLSITAILIPILGILGLDALMQSDDKNSFVKPLIYALSGTAGLCLFLILFGGGLFSFTHQSDGNYEPQLQEILIQGRKDYLVSSSIRSLIFILLSAGLVFTYAKGKISAIIMSVGLMLLGIFDLFQIDKKYLNAEDFVPARQYAQNFAPRKVDQEIKKDQDPNFRVLDVTVNTFNSASTSFHHKTIGGYNAAKLQRYQDLIDRHISKNNMQVLNMLNTKYFIQESPTGEPTYQRNPAALGNAWFVNQLVTVPNANAEIDSLTNFDPSDKAFVHEEFAAYIGDNKIFEKSGEIKLTTYHPNRLGYTSQSDKDQFAVFSEIWYGPDKGWNAYINGKPVEHIRVNYVLRAMKIPAGQNTIEFKFEPKSYAMGKLVAWISSIISFLLIGFAVYRLYKEPTV